MKQFILRLLIPMTLLSGCSTSDKDPIVAIVNGEKIHKSHLIDFLPPQARDQDISPYFDQLRERAIQVELALKKAIEEVKSDDPELTEKLADIKEDVLLDRYRHKLKIEHASDDKLEKAYEKFKADNPSQTEIRARHILVESENEAKAALVKINEGADFAELAGQVSKDKGAKGGDLGYFRAADMVKPFSDKAYALRDIMSKRLGGDDFTESSGDRGIVQTDFGWHVIEVLGSRASSHPPLTEMKETLESTALKTAIDDVTASLEKEHDVKMFNLDGTAYQAGYKIEDGKLLDVNQTLAQIGEKKYTKADLIAMIPNATMDTDIRPFYDRLVTEFIKKELLKKVALKEISPQDPEVKKELDIITQRLIVNIFLERKVNEQLQDKDLQDLYKDFVAKNPPAEEVNARHILVTTEDEAKEVVKALNSGQDFGEVALAKSSDKASGDGNLGFFTREKMVKPFSDKAFALTATKDTGKPEYGIAQSDFGWHVIETLERRMAEQPSFEQMKDKLHTEASQKIVDDLLVSLKVGAEVELFDLPKAEG